MIKKPDNNPTTHNVINSALFISIFLFIYIFIVIKYEKNINPIIIIEMINRYVLFKTDIISIANHIIEPKRLLNITVSIKNAVVLVFLFKLDSPTIIISGILIIFKHDINKYIYFFLSFIKLLIIFINFITTLLYHSI